jgi:hypothetical protein
MSIRQPILMTIPLVCGEIVTVDPVEMTDDAAWCETHRQVCDVDPDFIR